MTLILILDDNPDDLEILSTAFSSIAEVSGVVMCHSAHEALHRLEDPTRVSLEKTIVVTDLNMPRVDGFEFIQMLRATQDPTPVVIVLSTSSRRLEIDRAYRVGANAYHTKPMGYQETVDLCESIVSYWTQHARLPSSSSVVLH